jgi:hypothetical protein
MRKKTACFSWYGSCFDLVRSTKIEAPLIGLWPKSFSVTGTRRLGFNPDLFNPNLFNPNLFTLTYLTLTFLTLTY